MNGIFKFIKGKFKQVDSLNRPQEDVFGLIIDKHEAEIHDGEYRELNYPERYSVMIITEDEYNKSKLTHMMNEYDIVQIECSELTVYGTKMKLSSGIW